MKKMFKLSMALLVLMFFFSSIGIAEEAAAPKEEKYFSKTELQLHMDFDRDYGGNDDYQILTLTTEHFSEWKYGDVYLFLDMEGDDNYRANTNSMYYEIAPRFSLNRIFNTEIPKGFFGEIYATAQFNDGKPDGFDYINNVWLYGVSVDLNFQPNYGFSNLTFMYRDEETQDASYQITYVWGQPFKLGNLNMEFNGFVDYWEDDDARILITEPQIRLNLSSFVDKGSFLSNSTIGMEFEISRNFFSDNAGWQINPTVFFAVSF